MKKAFTDLLRLIKVGDTVSDDIANCSSVRGMCYSCGLRWVCSGYNNLN